MRCRLENDRGEAHPRTPRRVGTASLTPSHPSILRMQPMDDLLKLAFVGRRIEGAVAAGSTDVELAGRGDEQAFCRLIERYFSTVYGIALDITGSGADAEDVTQEVFMALPELLQSFVPGSFVHWLRMVARRKAMMHVRAERRHHPRPMPAEPIATNFVEERRLSAVALERALACLAPSLRAVFLLRELEGYTHEEIAEMTGISPTLSRVRLYHARDTLRRLLG